MSYGKLLDAALEKLSKKLKSPRCGYRSFDTVYDAQLWEHLHPTIPSSECEPPELRKAGGDQAECVPSPCPPHLEARTRSPHRFRLRRKARQPSHQ